MAGLFPQPRAAAATEDEWLIEQMIAIAISVDRLPYSSEFEAVYRRWRRLYGGKHPHRSTLFGRLVNMRKQGRIPRFGRKPCPPTPASNEGIGA